MAEAIYDFRSDNVGGAAPEMIEAIVAANTGAAAPYGADAWTQRLAERLDALRARVFAASRYRVPLGLRYKTGTARTRRGTGCAPNSHRARVDLRAERDHYGAIYTPRRWSRDEAHRHGLRTHERGTVANARFVRRSSNATSPTSLLERRATEALARGPFRYYTLGREVRLVCRADEPEGIDAVVQCVTDALASAKVKVER